MHIYILLVITFSVLVLGRPPSPSNGQSPVRKRTIICEQLASIPPMEPYFLTRVYGSKKDAPWFEELQTALKTKCGAKAQLDDGFVDVWYGPSIRHQNPTTLLVAKTDEKSKGPGGELILSGQCEQELLEEATHPEVERIKCVEPKKDENGKPVFTAWYKPPTGSPTRSH